MIRDLQLLVYFALYAVVFAVTVYALVDALRRPAAAFVSGGKRTKQFWTILLGAATAVAFVAIPWPVGFGMLSFLALGSAVAAGVYLADVRPAIKPYSGGSGRSRGTRGGW
ncbi:DUF2516 family protein [Actinotalea fermentans]|uniref:DUF2516 domain-containing protein n=1 Tax=Actinotalea fermentans TaxID=43671 RepID=A0A511Z0P4_9CELL|nr:DUF2516 family protein [Actinotalea fermentans]KGM15075.1 hypothetical protein N867_12215 [Actinotalea fermentans ATCC 43279 = JCM 9966 = DSM 3133]GEN81015.1 hypothetical protein AFE02nite_27490 [Actinotalea fermentans]